MATDGVLTAVEAPGREVRDPGTAAAIFVRGVTKVYGATVALAGADLTVASGEIHGLLGENGSGKSTLVRILAGVETADGGDIRLFGDTVGAPAERASDPAFAFIHQDLALFPTLSVANNIALRAGFKKRWGVINDSATVVDAQRHLDRLGMSCKPSALVGELPLADQTAVAIARALSDGVRLIVLDEPTAYLEARQVQRLLGLLGRLRDEGIACLLITHRADDVLRTCDRVTVLRGGRTVANRPVAGLTEPDLVNLITGDRRGTRHHHRPPNTSRATLELRAAEGRGFGPLSLSVRRGEVVGLCGLADAGTGVVGELAFGLSHLTSGELRLDGEPTTFESPREAMDAGVAYVPSDRRTEALAETLTARENLFMRPGRRISTSRERRRARQLLEDFAVHPPEPDRLVTTFSGGNQQKVVMAKWLDREPRLLVLNDPTAGVDVGSKAEIHAMVAQACADRGLAVLLISSDFDEVAAVADRTYVMFRGRLIAEVPSSETTPDHLISLAYGRVEK